MAITRVSNSVLNLSGHTGATGLPKGTEAQRPTPVAGMLRFNTETSGFEGYDGTEWGAIGGTGSTLVQDEFAGDGTTLAFTLSVSVVAEIFTSVYISGVYQEKNAYSISGTTLTFSVAPPNGASVEVITIDNIAITGAVSSFNSRIGAITFLDSDIPVDSISYDKLGTEFTTSAVIAASDVDFSSAQVFTKTLTADTTFTFSNTSIGMVKDLVVTGDFVITWPAGTKIAAGTYSGSVSNLIQVVVTAAGEYWLTISQEQV